MGSDIQLSTTGSHQDSLPDVKVIQKLQPIRNPQNYDFFPVIENV